VTAIQLESLRNRATWWARDAGKTDGFVVFFHFNLCGWSESFARLQTGGWVAGAVAMPVDAAGKALVAVGGDYQNGCERWEEIKA
jgi:hypothetical protein